MDRSEGLARFVTNPQLRAEDLGLRDTIFTHNKLYRTSIQGFVRHVLAQRSVLRRSTTSPPAPNDFDESLPPVIAFIAKSKWVGSCDVCGGAEDVEPTDPRFFCLSCNNGRVGGKWRRVQFPETFERRRIEAMLMFRPQMATRGWLPTETLHTLAKENLENGHEAPTDLVFGTGRWSDQELEKVKEDVDGVH